MSVGENLRVLHIDDDIFQLQRLQEMLRAARTHRLITITSLLRPEDFSRCLEHNQDFDLLIFDIGFSAQGLAGPDLIKKARECLPDAVIVMYSAHQDAQLISECMRLGADDFLIKAPVSAHFIKTLLAIYDLCKSHRQISSANAAEADLLVAPVVGATLQTVARRLPFILRSAISSLHVHGESGTGKEVVADLLAKTLAPEVPFVRVNCAALSPTLLESELFGYVRGAFTGAHADRSGLLEAADGGWIFLDEIAILSLPAQAALLRVIENQEIRRVGSTRSKRISIKVLSATNEQLPHLVRLGRFRADLWQRLCEAEIILPPLRERPDEIVALVKHFAAVMAGGPYRVSGAALQVLMAVPWREGNVRELRNCLRAMTELHIDQVLTPLSIPERIWSQYHGVPQSMSVTSDATTPLIDDAEIPLHLRAAVDDNLDFSRWSDLLLLELSKCAARHGRLSLRQLAVRLGMSRSTLSSRLHALMQRGIVDYATLAQLVNIHESHVSDQRSHTQTADFATTEIANCQPG